MARRRNPPKVDPEEQIQELIESGDEASYEVARDLALTHELTEYVVLLELAKALGEDPNDLVLTTDDVYGHDVFKVGVGRSREWMVVADDDAGEAIALADVTRQLESEPENFNQDWLQGHIDRDKLKKLVREIALEDTYVDELAVDEPEEFWLLAQREHVSIPDEDDDGNLPDEVDDEYIEAVKGKFARRAERDPEDYLSDLGVENIFEYAQEHGVGVDIKAAAEEAVSTDGWQHFLCGYDGNSHSLPSGHMYWRQN